MRFVESVEVGHFSCVLGDDRSATGNRRRGVRVSVDKESGYGQAAYEAGSQAASQAYEKRRRERAQRWARSQLSSPQAFHARKLGIIPERVGRVSIYHAMAGLHLVEALVANAMGDVAGAERAAGQFVVASRLPCDSVDVTVGRSGTLVGAALLEEAAGVSGSPTGLRCADSATTCSQRSFQAACARI